MWVWTDSMLKDAMNALTGHDTTAVTPLKNAVWGSCSAPLAASHSTKLADVLAVESGYNGYARTTGLTWSAPYIAQEGNMEADGPLIPMFGGNDSVSAQVFGEFLLSSDSTKLYGVNMFPAPIQINGTLTGGLDVPRTGITIAADKGNSVVSG